MVGLEGRIKAAAHVAVHTGNAYWETLAIEQDARLQAILAASALALSAASTRGSHCAVLRAFHRLTPVDCLLMADLFPGRLLEDASFGLRYTRRPSGIAGPAQLSAAMWVLRIVLEDGAWKVDPYTDEREWAEIGRFSIEAAGSSLAN